MKKINSIIIILAIMAMFGVLPAAAQTATVTVTYTENFNSFSYTGQEDDGSIIHAIGGGSARCNVAVGSLPTGAQLDSVYVRMSGVDNPVKLTSANGAANFTIADPSSVTTSTFTATVYYTNGEQHSNTTFNGNKSIRVYPLPTMPDAPDRGSDAVYERGASASISRSVGTATGGNANGWRYNWTITTTENGTGARTDSQSGNSLNYTVSTSFSSDVKNLREYALALEVMNENPVRSGQAWLKTNFTDFAGVKVYNTPLHQPAKLGHFTDKETNQDFYVAMNVGVSDTQISTGGYVFNFLGESTKTSTSRKLDNTTDPKTFNNVFVQWTYNDGYKVPASAPGNVEVVELSLDYKYTNIEIEPGRDYKDDERFLQEPVFKDDVLHYFSRSNVTLYHEVKGVGFDIEGGRVTSHLGTLLAGSTDATGNYTWRTLQPNTYDYYLEVRGRMRVETAVSVTLDITGMYTPNSKIQIWDLPVAADVNYISSECTDIEPSEMVFNLNKTPEGGVTQGWGYEWVRQMVENNGVPTALDNNVSTISTEAECVDADPINDDSVEMNYRKFEYELRYYNLAPDNETKWFTDTIKAGERIVYNAPDAPENLLYITDDKRTTIAAVNIGLSNEQLQARDYKFYYPEESSANAIKDEREYDGDMKPETVACLWIYNVDGKTFNALSEYAYKAIATLDETFVVETSTKDNEDNDIEGYLGSVKADNNIYALSGSMNKLKVQVSNNYTVEKASIGINNQPLQEAALEGNSASIAFCPEADEISEYGFNAQIEYRPILDSYIEDGKTKYVYPKRNISMSSSVSSSDRLHVYPRPVIPECKLDSVYLTDWQLTNLSYSVEKAAGANESGWSYTWESGEAEQIVNDMSCVVKLNSLGGIEGPANTIKNVLVRVKYANESPVAGENWYETYVNVADVNIYNRPNPVGELVKYKDEANEYLVATKLNCGDENLKRFEYIFRYFNGEEVVYEGNERTLNIKGRDVVPDKVCTVFTYPKDTNHNEYTIATDPIAFSGKEVTPEFEKWVTHVEDHRYDKYNFSYRHDDNLGFYDLVGTQYEHTLHTSGDFSLLNGRLDDMVDSQGTTLRFTRGFEEPGEYLSKVSGELQYAAEPYIAVAEGKYTKLHFDCTYPVEKTIHIYPEPVVPDTFGLDNVKFRDIDQIIPMNEEVPFSPSGANAEGWDFSWFFDEVNLGHSMVAEAQNISANDMQKRYHTFRYRWTNASPMPNDPEPNWMRLDSVYNVTVYNTPEAPGAFVRKGNGTSGIYIANNLPYDDEMLKNLSYQFQFGDNEPDDNNAILTENIGRRWYTYNSPSRPWVRSVWIYPGGEYICYSDYVISEGSRAELTLTDIFNYEGDDMFVYTLAGQALGNVSLRNLSTGLYIVEIGTGDDKIIKKVYVK